MRQFQVFATAVAFSALAVLGGCSKPAADSAAGGLSPDAKTAIDAILAAESQWNDDAKAKNVEKVVAHYSSDGTFMTPGTPSTHGSDQLRVTWRAMLDDPAFALSFKADKVWLAASGDLAYTQGDFSLTSTDAKTHQPATAKGTYVTVFKKAANGSWRALEDIISTAEPAPAASVAKGQGTPPKGEVDTAKDADAIRADETQWVADWKARDAKKVAGHYASDAVLMLPGAPTASGSSAIDSTVTEALKDAAFKVDFKADAVVVAPTGDLAYARGTYTQTSTDPKTHKVGSQKGSYVTVYAKQADGSWKAVEDIVSPGWPV